MNDVHPEVHTHDEHHPYSESPLSQLIYFLAGIAIIFLSLRFLLILLGAASTGIAGFIYDITQPIVSPFYGILGTGFAVPRFEWAAVFAMIATVIIAYLIASLLRMVRI